MTCARAAMGDIAAASVHARPGTACANAVIREKLQPIIALPNCRVHAVTGVAAARSRTHSTYYFVRSLAPVRKQRRVFPGIKFRVKPNLRAADPGSGLALFDESDRFLVAGRLHDAFNDGALGYGDGLG